MQTSKTRTSFYRRLYVAWLIDSGQAVSVPALMDATGMDENIFALTYFLVSSDENIAKYRKLVERSRQGETITKSVLLDVYGYEDDAALEKDWYEFMESRDFR